MNQVFISFVLSLFILLEGTSFNSFAMGNPGAPEPEPRVESFLETTFSWVDEGRHFAGSSCPGLNSPMGVDAKFLQDKVKGVISLNDAELDWSPLIAVGIQHLSVAVKDYQPPTVDQMKTIIEFIESLGPDAPVLIHCNAGMGRTGTVLASILVWKEGLSAEDAIKKVRSLRRGSVQTFKQEDGVKAWAKYLRTESHGL